MKINIQLVGVGHDLRNDHKDVEDLVLQLERGLIMEWPFDFIPRIGEYITLSKLFWFDDNYDFKKLDGDIFDVTDVEYGAFTDYKNQNTHTPIVTIYVEIKN